MSKYTKTVANTPESERASVSKSLKTNIHKHTGFGHVKDPSKSLSIDPEKSAGYNSQVIALAAQLKYQGESDYTPTEAKPQKFDDSFYLDYAQRKINMRYDSSYDKVLTGIDVAPDPKYAQYSYDEIIAMANSGVNIPKSVLAWAKGQQEADVVDYVVVSENAEYNDENSQDKNSGESEINKIRAEVKDYAIKSKKAQEDIVKNKEKTNEYANQAANISRKQKNKFKNNSIDKTEEMTNEWKKLDKKKKEGSITSQEYKKYMQLSEKLSDNSDIIKEMQKDSLQLDNFLESIDNLHDETIEGLSTANKTINAADNLSDLDDGLNIFYRVHAYRMAASSSAALEDNLSGINDIQLALVADKIAHDLQNIGDEVKNEINSNSTQETIDFADEYIHKAKHVENVLGIESYDDGIAENQKEDTNDNDVNETKEKDDVQDKTLAPEEDNKISTAEETDVKMRKSSEMLIDASNMPENNTASEENIQVKNNQSDTTVQNTQQKEITSERVAQTSERQTEEITSETVAQTPEQQTEEINPAIAAQVPNAQTSETNPNAIANTANSRLNETEANSITKNADENNPNIISDTRMTSFDEESENEPQTSQVNNKEYSEEISAASEQNQTVYDNDDFRDYAIQNLAMGKNPQEIIESYSNSPEFKVTRTKSAQTKNEKGEQTGNTNQTENNKQNDVISDAQAGLKSEYGDNTDFVKLVVANNIMNLIGLGPSGFIFGLIKWAAIVGLSVLDLYSKKGIVDESADVANVSVKESGDAAKALNAKSNQIKAEHEKNLAESKAYAEQMKELNDQSIDYQSEKFQEQMKLVESGKMAQEQVEEFEDPNAGSKNAIRQKVAGIEDKDAKLLETIKEPAAKTDKIHKESNKSVDGFRDLNGKLTDRNDNNDKVGDVIIAEAIVAQGIITALIATLLACGPWCWSLAAAWAVALVQNAAFAATGVAAKAASNNVENKIDKNKQQINDNQKSLNADNKKMKDVQKVINKAKLDKMNLLPPEQEAHIEKDKIQGQKNNSEDNGVESEINNNNSNNNELAGNNASNSYVRKENDTKSGFNQSSLNSELSGNNPNDVQMANEYAKVYTNRVNEADEKSRSAAAIANTDASSKFDTTDKADVKLARFNKEGAIDSKKRTQRVNAASSAQNHRNRR